MQNINNWEIKLFERDDIEFLKNQGFKKTFKVSGFFA